MGRVLTFRVFITLVGLVLCLGARAFAAGTYYVAVGGNDFNPGTSGQPFATIQKGITAASAGDTIIVGDGTYSGSGNRDLSFGGKDLTLRSVNGPNATVIECGGIMADNHRAFNFSTNETNASVVEGFTITHGFISAPGDAVAGAVYVGNASPTFRSCIFSSNHIVSTAGNAVGGAVVIANSAAISQAVAFTNCLFNDNQVDAANNAVGGAIFIQNGIPLNITNCTFTRNKLNGTAFNAGTAIYSVATSTTTVLNSILYGDSGTGAVEIYNAGPVNVSYSDVQGGYPGAGNIDADPLFVSSSNFQLQKTSYAVDSGTSSGAPATDLRGVSRPLGNGTDMGAYEFNAFSESLVVTTLSDEDNGTSDPAYGTGTSLREAINYANSKSGDDTITFPLYGTISLTSQLPTLNSNIAFSGPGADALTIACSGTEFNSDFRIFLIAKGQTVSVSGLAFANAQSSGNGAAIYNRGQLTVNECVFSNNTGVGGGAIYNDGLQLATLDITGSTFENNKSTTGNIGGGALYCYGPTGVVTVSGSTFNGNSADNAGGAIRNSNNSTLTLRNCTLSGNSANNAGGAIYNDATLSVDNCTLTGNRADADGNNAPGVNGGAIYAAAGSATLNNSIVAGNLTGTGNTPDDLAGTFGNATYNLIGNAASSGGLTNGTNGNIVGLNGSGTRPIGTILDTTLADNSGPTKTHALASGSAAINAGDPAYSGPLTTDQRGDIYARKQGARIDIGAYEAPVLVIDNVTVTEGNSGTVNANFTVSLSAPSSKIVTAKYATSTPGSNAATAGVDYTAVPLTTLTLYPGTTSWPVTVQVKGDTLDEVNERFVVNLSAATNASIADGEAFGTIIDDDAPPSLAVNNVTVTEGNSGTTPATFTVTLSAASSKTVTVQYSTNTPGSIPATAGSDYTALATTTLIFQPGETSKQVTVLVNGDLLDEDAERFSLNLKNAGNATIADKEGFCTINDDDAAPSLRINDVSLAEGPTQGVPGGTTAFTFTVTLSAASGKTVKVNYQTTNPGALIATPGTDYTAVPLTTLTLAPGQTSKTLTVLVNGDTTVEGTERFVVKLSTSANATIADAEGFGTILNDDTAAPLLFEDDAPSE